MKGPARSLFVAHSDRRASLAAIKEYPPMVRGTVKLSERVVDVTDAPHRRQRWPRRPSGQGAAVLDALDLGILGTRYNRDPRVQGM